MQILVTDGISASALVHMRIWIEMINIINNWEDEDEQSI